MQNVAKFKGKDVTGVFAVQCARHQFFEPGGMVDLQKGERKVYLIQFERLPFLILLSNRYCNSDYALASVLMHHRDQRFIKFSYDIECHHSVNRIARFIEWFPELVPLVRRIVGCIPKMHINNHKEDCMYRFSFNYTTGVGCTCGEGIETTWAEANQTAGSTKKENRGHRHDTLDDFHSYWNWEKIVKMRM
jgi:hypothetical protein